MSLKITFKTISTVMVLLVLFFVLAYPTASPLRGPIIAMAFAWSFFREILSRRFLIRTPMHTMWAIGFFLLVVLSVNWHLYPQALNDVLTSVLCSMMISMIIVDYVVVYRVSAIEFAKLLVPIALFFLFNTLLNGTRDAENRLSIGINDNNFGKIGTGMAWLFMYACCKTHWKKLMWVLLMVAVSLLALLSGSRRVMISLVIYAVGIMGFEYPSKDAIKLAGKIIGAFVVLLVAYIMILKVDALYNTIGRRVESLVQYVFADGQADGSTFSRMNMQMMAMKLFGEHPLLGAGINAFKYHTYYGTYSHSNYMELLSGLGIVGFCFYYTPILVYMINSVQLWLRKSEGIIVPLCFFLSFMINEYGGVSYFSYVDHVYLAVAIGLVYCSKKASVEQ